MKVTVSRKAEFDAAHFLPNYPGKCANLHGHRWVVEVGVKGEVNPVTGFVVDFTFLKKSLSFCIEDFDHSLINNRIDNPTAEHLIRYILTNFRVPEDTELEFIKIWETPDSCAEYKRE